MKREYKRPEIKLNLFETSDVISTSCTCNPTFNCHNKEDKFVYSDVFYTHNFGFVKLYSDADMIEYSKVGSCPDHGDIYKVICNDPPRS